MSLIHNFTKKNCKLKVAACYVLFNEEDYIKQSIDSIYNWTDKIYLLLGKPFDNIDFTTDETEDIISNYPDPDRKMMIFMADIKDETLCKNILLDMCRKDGMDYCWIVDGDEVYNEFGLRVMFYYLEKNKPDAIRGWAREYWRSLHHTVGVSEHFIMFRVFDGFWIRIRCPGINIKEVDCVKKDIILFHHYGMARTPERIRLKYTSTQNRVAKGQKFDFEKWFNEKFLAWEENRNISNLQPFKGELWKKTSKVEEKDIPESMKSHKWYNVDCIK